MAPGDGDPMEDLDALASAFEALDEDGVDADPADLDGAIAVFEALDEVAAGDDSEGAEEARDELNDVLQGLRDVAGGGEPDMPIDELTEKVEAFHGLILQQTMQAMLGGAM